MKETLELEDAIEKLCPECRTVLHEKMVELWRCFEEGLDGRKKVEKAKWLLVMKKGIDEEEAHRLLQATARRQRKKLVEIAEAVMIGDKFFFTEGDESPACEIVSKKKGKKGKQNDVE